MNSQSRERGPASERCPAPSTLADRLVSELSQVGVDTYFGVPGGAIEPLFNALARNEERGRVRLIPMRSESGAGFAADGYFRQVGRMAVCTGTAGPGITNLITPVMSAHADRIPLLVLTPQVSLTKHGRGALQDSSCDGSDTTLMLRECTKYSTTVTHPDQLPHKLRRALITAWTAPYGPVHLSIPSDVLSAPSGSGSPAWGTERPVPSRAVDRHAVQTLLAALLAASAPVFYVGDDAGPEAPRLLEAARALGGLVVSSPAGKRWLGHKDPYYRGAVGFSGSPAARDALRQASVIAAFGATFDELSTNAWSIFPGAALYSVDRHAEHAYRIPGTESVIAGIEDVVEPLLESVAPHIVSTSPEREPNIPPQVAASESGPVHPALLMDWLGLALPDDVAVHLDAGNSFSWSTRYLQRTRPDTYRVAMGLSSMGWGVSSVLGAAVASGRRTVCVTGDGSMLMSALELTVAVERQLPVTYVILNDAGLGMVRHGQRLAGAAPVANAITPVRFDRLAKACGAEGFHVRSFAELRRIPQRFLAGDEAGPCVIDVSIDRDAVPPMADRVLGLAVGVPK